MEQQYQVIEFEHSVEIHPVCEKDLNDNSITPLNWNNAKSLALKTLENKLLIHNNHYNDWEDPKDLDIINKLKEAKTYIVNFIQEEYLDFVFFK